MDRGRCPFQLLTRHVIQREESGAKATVGETMTTADGGYPGAGLVMPHRRKGEDPPVWKQAHNKTHKQVRARVGHVFARLHNLSLTG
ncbi:hypothetical protein GCM10009646_86450 [Streptomyces aureus]